MPVKEVKNKTEYDAAVSAKGLVVVDFMAQWCGPCKRISPFLEGLSEQLTSASFIKVDVDEASDVAQAEGISAMPTFYLYKDGKKVADMVGADQGKLKTLIEQHSA